MKIIVLVKQTPDTEAQIKISADGKSLDTSAVKFIVNPYDEYAIEEALQIKKKVGSGEVVVVSFGPSKAKERLLRGLAMGADRGLLIQNEGLEHCDSLSIAKVLVEAIKQESPDLVLCGKQAIDDDNMHVGTMVAEFLNWPHVNVATKLELDGKKARVEREVEGGQQEIYEVMLPAVIGAHKSMNSPRYASLPGIMKAKKKPFDLKTTSDLGINIETLKEQNKTLITSYKMPATKSAGKIFKDEPMQAMVEKVVKSLREEAKAI